MLEIVSPLLRSIDFADPDIRAAWVGAFYFGTFITVGWVAKRGLRSLLARHSEDLAEIHKQAGDSARKGDAFLLGIWRKLY